ncbi:MAG: MerR family transcriptional regulator [Pseudomonadota bacterium]
MDKSPEAFRTISEVSSEIDVPAHVLRFWESRFNQIRPVKRGGGRRYYRPEDVKLLRGIRDLLYTDGLTIKGVQKVLREQGVKRVSARGAAAEDSPAPVAEAARTSNGHDTSPATPRPAQAAETVSRLRGDATSGRSSVRGPERIEALRDVIHRLERLRDRIRED